MEHERPARSRAEHARSMGSGAAIKQPHWHTLIGLTQGMTSYYKTRTASQIGSLKAIGSKPMSQKSAANHLGGRVRTLKEVAALLRISRGSAYEAAKRKEIPTIRIGRRLLVPSDALEKLLSGNIAI